MTNFIYVLYNHALWPLLKLAFRVLSLFNDKIAAGFALRRSVNGRKPWLDERKQGHPIWIHCASGELEYAKPVIAQLKKRAPDQRIVLTFFSPSVAGAALKLEGVDFACPLPWDEPTTLHQFIAWHCPRVLLIARTDTWPEMLRSSRRAGIKILLFAATLPKNSGRARGLGRVLSRAVFSNLNQIFCVSEEDRVVFSELGFVQQTEVAGDTRYDQVFMRLQKPKALKEELFSGHKKDRTLVAGSLWPEDETALMTASKILKQSNRRSLSLILVPHEPTPRHLEQLEGAIKKDGFRSVRYSTALSWNSDLEILVVDQTGILAELYLKGSYALVGGSFRKTVHSVMEPLATGAVTFVGPFCQNNREALRFSKMKLGVNSNYHAVTVCANADELAARLAELDDCAIEHDAERIRSEVHSLCGKSERVVDWTLAHLKTTLTSAER